MKKLCLVLMIAIAMVLPLAANASCCGVASYSAVQLAGSDYWVIEVICWDNSYHGSLFHNDNGAGAANFVQSVCLGGEVE